MKKLWMRAGISLMLADEEIDEILGGCEGAAGEEAVVAALREGRFTFDGDSYIPQSTVEEFTKEHGLPYAAKEPDLHMEEILVVLSTGIVHIRRPCAAPEPVGLRPIGNLSFKYRPHFAALSVERMAVKKRYHQLAVFHFSHTINSLSFIQSRCSRSRCNHLFHRSYHPQTGQNSRS